MASQTLEPVVTAPARDVPATPTPTAVKRLSLALYDRLDYEPGFVHSEQGYRKAADSSIRKYTGYVLLCCVVPVIAIAGLFRGTSTTDLFYLCGVLSGTLTATFLFRSICAGILRIPEELDVLRDKSGEQREQHCRAILSESCAAPLRWGSLRAWFRGAARRAARKAWPRLAFVQPFSFQNIWWWSLILGVLRIAFAFVEDPGQRDLNKYAQDVTAALIISAIAFIASNLVGQLLYVRDRFQAVQDKVEAANTRVAALTIDVERNATMLTDKLSHEAQSLTSTLRQQSTDLTDTLRANVSDVQRTMHSSLRVLELVTNSLNAGEQWRELRRHLDTQGEVSALWEKLIQMLEKFASQVQAGGDDLRPFLAMVLGHFLESQGTLLNTHQRRVMTKFVNLSRMVHSIMTSAANSPDSRWVAYGLFVLPPLKFLNYNGSYRATTPTAAKWESEEAERGLTDIAWWRYLDQNLSSRSGDSKLSVKRYFLAVTLADKLERIATDLEAEKETIIPDGAFDNPAYRALPEIRGVRAASVKYQLNRYVLCDERRIPLAIDPASVSEDERYVLWESVGSRLGVSDGDARPLLKVQFQFAENPPPLTPVLEGKGAMWLRFGEVLGTVFHRPGHAWVIDYDQTRDSNLSALVDPISMKPKDFFALGARASDQDEIEWKLCLRSTYDRDFDVADVEIVHSGADARRWNDVVEELNHIFVRTSGDDSLRVTPIEQYGIPLTT